MLRQGINHPLEFHKFQKNLNIYNDILDLAAMQLKSNSYIIGKYVKWEIDFLKNLGYGLNIKLCAVSGKTENVYFIPSCIGPSITALCKNEKNNIKKIEKVLFII